MSSDLASPDSEDADPVQAEDWVVAVSGRSQRAVRDAALVLASRGIEHVVDADGRGARVMVRATDAARARGELGEYDSENENWPPPSATPRMRSDGIRGAALYVFFLVIIQVCAQYGAARLPWRERGVLDSGLVRSGELERALTALTLHVDLTHLVSNAVFGVGFGVLAAHVLGGGLTWSLALLSGFAGNLTNALVQGEGHRSMGASTGVFGLLGLLAAHEWTRRSSARQAAMRRLAPLLGGAVLFGWLGVGDTERPARVDVLAHLFGAAHGAILGFAAARLDWGARVGSRGQAWLACASAAAVGASWVIALARP